MSGNAECLGPMPDSVAASGTLSELPGILAERSDWAIVIKPHGVPSAPLTEGERGTLLAWFLDRCPEAGSVVGRKAIERGLIHRLDTGTTGVVLIAKTQKAYDALIQAQGQGLIRKTYFAFCSLLNGKSLPVAESLPLSIVSRFRAFGPGRREVRPLFHSMRGYAEAGAEYETVIEEAKPIRAGVCAISCGLTRGYRHQVRAHLSYLGYPILGDLLYNAEWRGRVDTCLADHEMPLQLYATGISFPDPLSGDQVSFSLPRPDKTIP